MGSFSNQLYTDIPYKGIQTTRSRGYFRFPQFILSFLKCEYENGDIHKKLKKLLMVTLYVLKGKTDKRYVGITNNLPRRLRERRFDKTKGGKDAVA